MRALLVLFSLVLFFSSASPAQAFAVDFGPDFHTRSVPVDGGTVSVTVGGSGPVVVLLHGYTQDSRMWKPLAERLKSRFTIVAPDLPGIGNSSIPSSGLDMKTAAQRIHAVVHALGYRKVMVVGHDIGLMVAYGYAALYRSEVTRLALLDAFIPGVEGWQPIYDSPNYWHFRFYGPTPLALVSGRETIYFAFFWNDLAANASRSLSATDRANYVAAYSRPGRMAAGWGYFAKFPQTAIDFAQLAKTKLTIPVLSIGGEKSLGTALASQAKLISDHVTVVVVNGAGHWILEEKPAETMAAVSRFLEAQ